MPRARHWENTKTPGATVFVTMRTLDFAHVFARNEVKSLVLENLLNECKKTETILHAYVVMVNHIHFVCKLESALTISELMRRYKNSSSKGVLRRLEPYELALLSAQRGLDGRQLWQRSFRAFPIVSRTMLHQKIRYIHLNPVRATFAATPGAYQFSSAALFEQGLWTPEYGLQI